jgi:4-amino-4-deoxy-L-arabinose transferase-like glycosyltransferase
MEARVYTLPPLTEDDLPDMPPSPSRHHWHEAGAAVICALTIAAGQVVALSQSRAIITTADTPSYLDVAHAITDHLFFFDATRTPGYPALLALVFHIAGRDNMAAAVNAQATLLVLAMGEVAVLMRQIFARPYLSALVSSLIALNPYLLNWERAIGTEALSLWEVVTCFLCFALFARTRRWPWLAALAIMSALAVLTRPFFIFLPFLLFGMLLAWLWLIAAPRRQLWHALIAGVGCGVAILAFMAGNAVACGYFGLSDVGTINLFGKVLEYHMENESTGIFQIELRQDLQMYLRTSRDPWGFPYHYPQDGRDHYAAIAVFSDDIILGHLPEFAAKTAPDLLMTLNAYPTPYVPFVAPLPLPVVTLLNISYAELALYVLLPFLLALAIRDFWRDPASSERLLILVLALGVACTAVVAAAGAYTVPVGGQVAGDFYRLRSPIDWAMIALLLHALIGLRRQSGTALTT